MFQVNLFLKQDGKSSDTSVKQKNNTGGSVIKLSGTQHFPAVFSNFTLC